jgi:plasmid stabilization system protein ParE
MSLKIISAPTAGVTLSTIYNFIEERFGSRSAEKFLQDAEKTIALIADNPLMFRASSFDMTVRIGFISKQTSLFYRVSEDAIHLLFFRDNRQEPIFK